MLQQIIDSLLCLDDPGQFPGDGSVLIFAEIDDLFDPVLDIIFLVVIDGAFGWYICGGDVGIGRSMQLYAALLPERIGFAFCNLANGVVGVAVAWEGVVVVCAHRNDIM
jgi:hypothetical protein